MFLQFRLNLMLFLTNLLQCICRDLIHERFIVAYLFIRIQSRRLVTSCSRSGFQSIHLKLMKLNELKIHCAIRTIGIKYSLSSMQSKGALVSLDTSISSYSQLCRSVKSSSAAKLKTVGSIANCSVFCVVCN